MSRVGRKRQNRRVRETLGLTRMRRERAGSGPVQQMKRSVSGNIQVRVLDGWRIVAQIKAAMRPSF
jgi:hypothetical protein